LCALEFGVVVVPGSMAAGEANEKSVGTLVLKPVFYLLGDPGRCGCFRRSKQNEISGLGERLFDRRPKMRRRRETRVISEDSKSAAPVPALAKLLHNRLQCRCDQLILI